MIGLKSPSLLAEGYLRSKYQQGPWLKDSYEITTNKACGGVVDEDLEKGLGIESRCPFQSSCST